jgi:SAM-dependent methyltransferase
MPSIEENLKKWDGEYHWKLHGEEWSRYWGNSQIQWDAMIYPKIEGLLKNSDTILEIAPGYGRWTAYLTRWCKKFYGVDLSPSCVEFCKERFNDKINEFYVNDGLSLDMIPDNICDFVFSFDSLVHAEVDVLFMYLPQIYNKLKDGGAAFLHISNLGGITPLVEDPPHWRARTTSGLVLAEYARTIGFECEWELVDWCGHKDLDCFLTLRR